MGFQNFKQTSSEEASTADFYTIQPTFTIKDLKKAEPFMKKCVDLTRTEAGCMYYGWTIQGDKLFCREGCPGPPREHRGGRRRDARFGRRVAGQDRVPRPEGGLADVQEDRRRIRRHL